MGLRLKILVIFHVEGTTTSGAGVALLVVSGILSEFKECLKSLKGVSSFGATEFSSLHTPGVSRFWHWYLKIGRVESQVLAVWSFKFWRAIQ